MFVVIVETSRPFSARPRLVKHAEAGFTCSWLRFAISLLSLSTTESTSVYIDATGEETTSRVEKPERRVYARIDKEQ